jgi:hypothetical protein
LTDVETAPPNLVLSDVFMPELDGWSLAAELRRRFPAVQVVMMSAYRPDFFRSDGCASSPSPSTSMPSWTWSRTRSVPASRRDGGTADDREHGIALTVLILGVLVVWIPGLALIGFGASRFVRGWKAARRDSP